jgi:hypothetical protein
MIRLKAAADIALGPGEPLTLKPGDTERMERDLLIAQLAGSGHTYIDIARQLDAPLTEVVNRVAAMLRGHAALSPEQAADYLTHQLELLNIGIENALADMADRRDGEDGELSSRNRHFGRQALAKFLMHQAAVLGLLRQRMEIDKRERVEIVVVRPEEYEAL